MRNRCAPPRLRSWNVKMDRKEYLAWCKQRALEYVEAGEYVQALSSLTVDLMHERQWFDMGVVIHGTSLMATGHLRSKQEMTDFINGFN